MKTTSLGYYIISEEEVIELSIDAGAEDCISNEKHYEIYCDKEKLYKVKNNMEKKILNFIFTGIEWIPLNRIEVDNEKIDNIVNFLDILEEDDDVQNIYTNIKKMKIN